MRSFIIRRTPFRSASISSPIIQRHGPSDGVIILNVGGKNFQTLRSTIAQNDVLMDHVVRAETNMEIMGTDHAIFIDRDPKHFGMILAYLRNLADGIYRHPSVAPRLMKFGSNKKISSNCTTQSTKEVTPQIAKLSCSSMIQLPKDSKTLTEMYFESIHYNIPELTNRICSQHSLARVFGVFGSTNPFQMATTALTNGKRMLVLFGGMLTGMGGWVYAQAIEAQAKTSKFLEDSGGGDLMKQTDYWKEQTSFWKTVADRWNGSREDT